MRKEIAWARNLTKVSTISTQKAYIHGPQTIQKIVYHAFPISKTMTAKTHDKQEAHHAQYHTTPPKAKHASTNPETKGNMNLKTLNINARLVNGKLNT